MTKPKTRKLKPTKGNTPLRNEFAKLTEEPQDPSPFPTLDVGFNWEDEQRRMIEESRLYQRLRAQGLDLAREERARRKRKRKLQMLNSFIGGCLFLLIAIVFDRRSK